MVGLLNTYLPLTVIVFVINVKWFTTDLLARSKERVDFWTSAKRPEAWQGCLLGAAGRGPAFISLKKSHHERVIGRERPVPNSVLGAAARKTGQERWWTRDFSQQKCGYVIN